jgi:F0F1-type ATP synthase beta subunit
MRYFLGKIAELGIYPAVDPLGLLHVFLLATMGDADLLKVKNFYSVIKNYRTSLPFRYGRTV